MTQLTMIRGKGGRWSKGSITPAAINSQTVTREAWLNEALSLIRNHLHCLAAVDVPTTTKVSCGLAGGRIGSKRIGECWNTTASADGSTEIFISPVLSDITGKAGVLATLVHEAIHAAVGVEHGHKKPFKTAAIAAGLEGKMTATYAGDALLATIANWGNILGSYPHASMSGEGRKKQSTRLIKAICLAEGCGHTVRTTQKWIDKVGATLCPCNGLQMHVDSPSDDDGETE